MNLSVAVYDMADGRGTAYGADRVYVTASVVKTAILAALLFRAQDTGRWLTAEQERLAEEMMRRSDNDAATALREAVGGIEGLRAAHARLGMGRTEAERAWGLTRTTASDQLTLLRAVFAPEAAAAALDGDSRAYLAGLMGRVVPGQDWGVSAAGGDWALKNGWLPRSDSGLWVIHSVGRVDHRLMAVLSDGHASMEEGIARVEEAAKGAMRRPV
ncbi:serine hydrolase [Streptomyces sp. NRRL F-5135]|uniref:serine hydrolase n=1 Tax=Streptomyces sp. NRRL F-5135 TaxID=1463858 RepID=UPI000AC5831F|nr:serine hydrolase [Streptomyces sp. NRRL F-5135]